MLPSPTNQTRSPLVRARESRGTFNYGLTLKIALLAIAASALKYGIDTLDFARLPLTALTGSILSAVTFVIGFVLNSLIKDYKDAEKLPIDIATAINNLGDDGAYFAHQLPNFDDTSLRANLLQLCDLSVETIRDTINPDLDTTLRAVLRNISDLDLAGAPPNHTVRMKTDVFLIRRSLERARYIRKIFNLPTAHTLVVTVAVVGMGLLLLTRSEHRVGIAVSTGVLAFVYAYLLRLIAIVENPFAAHRNQRLDDISLYSIRETAADLQTRPASSGRANSTSGIPSAEI